MRDEIDARAWAAHHEHFSSGMAWLWADIRLVFERLTAQLYDAPWTREIETDCRR